MTSHDPLNIQDDMGETIETYIRVAERRDARAVLGLLRHVERETPYLSFGLQGSDLGQEDQARIIEFYDRSPSSIMIVAEVDDQIIGLANVSQYSGAKENHVAEVGVCVIKEYWSFGIGKILVEESIRFAETTAELQVLSLEVVQENERAIRLYEKFDFEKVGSLSRRIQVDSILYDTYIMEKIIK